jgi:phosphotransferase system enzyme I (PtsI)
MYPMVISAKEIEEVLAIAKQVKEELSAEKIPYKEVKSGIMIETPAAAIISDELSGLVDFFSIGTNDLTQYTLAIDRQNGRLDSIYDPYHKAVLRMIQMVTEHAHKAGISVGICGELATDSKLTEWFIDIGLDELSVTPASILKLRQRIREMQ